MNLDPKILFSGIDRSGPVIVSVSGGGDSIALLLLCVAWARSEDVDLVAATVDHGLRPEAAAEAAFVAGVCEGLDVPHVTLAWEGAKPTSGIMNAARVARYQLLERYASELGSKTIVTGHTANDQAETVSMRLLRDSSEGSGRGLAGMAGETRLANGTRLVRPLLSVTRETLRNYLKDHHQPWIEDPSNTDEAYERIRVRKELDQRPERVDQLVRFAAVMGRFRRQISAEAVAFLSKYLQVSDGPVYRLDVSGFSSLADPVRQLALQSVIALAGGAEYLVSARSVGPLVEQALGQENKRTTLGNAVIEKKASKLVFYREARNVPAIVIGAGQEVLWDGRLRIRNSTRSSLFCGPLSAEQLADFETDAGARLSIQPRAAVAALPFIRGNGDDILVPFLSKTQRLRGVQLEMTARAIANFCPEFDYPLLDWLTGFCHQSGLTGQPHDN